MSLDIGCRHHKSAELGVDIKRDSDADILASAEFLPFGTGIFESVMAFETLEHIENPKQALSEIHRLLRLDGLFKCSIPNLFFWRNLARFLIVKRISVSEGHIYGWGYTEFLNLLKSAGFRLKEHYFTTIPRNHKKSTLSFLPHGFGHHSSIFISEKRDTQIELTNE